MAFTDNFNRASLGAGWETVLGTDWVTASSLYLKPGGQYQQTGVRVVGTFPNDQYAEVFTEVVSAAGDPASTYGPAVRMDDQGNCYFATITAIEVNIWKRVAGTNTYLDAFAIASAVDTLIKLKLVATGESLELYVSGVLRLTTTDADLAAGNPGCRALTGQTSTIPRFDTFESTEETEVGGGGGEAGPSPNTTRDVFIKPAVPTLGAAGYAFDDPTFRSRMWRASDTSTSSGSAVRVPSSAHATAWNSDSTKFYGVNTGGGAIFFAFDGETITDLGELASSTLEPQFSWINPDLVFGVNGLIVKTWNIDTAAVATIVNLDTQYPSLVLEGTVVGGILLADGDKFACHFGGTGIDLHKYVHHSTAGLLDISGLGWIGIHAISIGFTGRDVLVYPANDPETGTLPPGVGQVYLWDTQVGTTLIPITVRPAGHDSHGYDRRWINQDCCSAGVYDAAQWQSRSLAAPGTVTDLIPNVQTPEEIYLAEHSNWRAALPGVNVPIVSINYRYGAGLNQTTYPWRAWDEEVIRIATDGSGVVERYAHHQSVDPSEFWNQPMPNVSPDGRWCIFTSNWGGTVGAGRQDIFIVELIASPTIELDAARTSHVSWNLESRALSSWNGEGLTLRSYPAPCTAESWNAETRDLASWNAELAALRTYQAPRTLDSWNAEESAHTSWNEETSDMTTWGRDES